MKSTFKIDGRCVAYSCFGQKDNDLPLVFLHGFCEDSSVWNTIVSLLPGRQIILVDLPGFGGSDLPPATGIDIYASVVCSLLNELGIRRCVLFGHSMGGYTALAFAKHYAERLAGFSLVHSHPYEDTVAQIENRRRGIDMLQAGKKDLYVAQLFPTLFAPDFLQRRPEVVEALVHTGRQQQTEGICNALYSMIDRPNHLDTLRASANPVQFILGELDSIVPPERALAAAILPAICDIRILPGVGHMGMLEATGKMAQAIREFWQFCSRTQRLE